MNLKKIKKLLFCCIIATVSQSCSQRSNNRVDLENQIIEYLNERYPEDEFEILTINSATAPGDEIRSYTSKVSSKNYSRRDFYMTFKVKERLISAVEDTYANLLLEEAYLDMMREKFQEDDSLFYDTYLGYLNTEQPYLKNINEAKEYLRNNSQIDWVDLIGLYIDDYDDKTDLNNKVTDIAYDLHEIYKGGHEIIVHFYPKELQQNNLQFLSDNDVMDKAPQREDQIAFWTINWRDFQLEETNGKLEPFIESRKEIKQWRNKAN